MLKTLFHSEEPSELEGAARPLLRLAQHLTGMESTFVTSINWESLDQTVLHSLNVGEMQVPEGMTVDWHDSMCRSLFLSGVAQSCDVGTEIPATGGAIALGMQTFVAVPIVLNQSAIGTICGASKRKIVLDDDQLKSLGLIGEALQQLVELERRRSSAQDRAAVAEEEAMDARLVAERHADEVLRLEHLANTDALTGLPNRRAFMARWEDELARSGRRHYPIGLMLIDADHFKAVNDSGGHALGDSVLRAIGTTLMSVAQSPDVVARLGGDEFALVATHTDPDHLATLATRIRQLFAVAAKELGVSTTLSIGMVSSLDCPRDKMLADADAALYRSKNSGGDAAQMYSCHPDAMAS